MQENNGTTCVSGRGGEASVGLLYTEPIHVFFSFMHLTHAWQYCCFSCHYGENILSVCGDPGEVLSIKRRGCDVASTACVL